jgi:hypothetical protein
LEQDGDVVADLTDARWRCRAASVVGETDHVSGSFFRGGWVLRDLHKRTKGV